MEERCARASSGREEEWDRHRLPRQVATVMRKVLGIQSSAGSGRRRARISPVVFPHAVRRSSRQAGGGVGFIEKTPS